MATIQDIADEVGISKAAVSRILNKKGSFNKATISRVFQVAKQLNYTLPNAAQLLNEQYFKVIGAVLPIGHSPYYSVLVSLLEEVAYSYGYSLMVCSSMYDKEKEEEFFNVLRDKRISGIIYGSFNSQVEVPSDEWPIVTVGHRISEEITVIKSDNYAAGRIAAKHLIGKGCKSFLYISAYQVGEKNDERFKGFAAELSKRNLSMKPYFTGGNDNPEYIFSAITQMFLDNPDAEAIFVESQALAIKCLKVCDALGIAIPRQMKLVSYGTEALSLYSYPEVTMVIENTAQIAYEAVTALVEQIEESSNPKKNEIVLPVSLSQKQTS